MNSQSIRNKFKKYFGKNDHKWIKSSSLIPQKDPSLLFVNAGMNQFKNFFLGLEQPPHPQVCSIQKCLRAGGKHNDLEEVGHSLHHHTFFEMMGHFCFGSYSKREAIHYAMEFLTKELHLPKERLWMSIFKEDKESAEIWKKDQNIVEEKLLLLGQKSNFWRMGDTGPCGPCSEIYFNPNPDNKNPKESDLIEIWNLVFMSFNEDKQKKQTPLPKQCIDTGMGLERISMILQNKTNNYATDLFTEIIKSIEKKSGKKYYFEKPQQTEEQIAFRVIADHSRAISFLISDGVLPGNEGASYVLRRVMRRALFYSYKLSKKQNLLETGVKKTIELMQEFYPELKKEQASIQSTIKEEDQKFSDNLKAGRKILLQKMKNLPNKKIDPKTAWDLYSTYGFPPDLTRLIAQEQGFSAEGIELSVLKKQMELKESVQKYAEKERDIYLQDTLFDLAKKVPIEKTKKTCYKKNEEQAKILFIINTSESHMEIDPNTEAPSYSYTIPATPSQSLKENEEGWVLLDTTCFYPEGGGPIGDRGTLKTKTGQANILDCQEKAGFISHKIKIIKGEIEKEQKCEIKVNEEHRKLIATSHSATHLLHHVLRKILGRTVKQKGSLVKPGELRFDFSYPNPLTEKQLQDIEEKVNLYINKNSDVGTKIQHYKEAISEGALSMAGENYSEKVRVVSMGDSVELCGGIHVKNTNDIQEFKIISETGVQSGVRRILAYTSKTAKDWLENLEKQNRDLRKFLKISLTDTSTNNPFISWWEKQNKEIKSLQNQLKKNVSTGKTDNKQPTPEINSKHNRNKYLLAEQMIEFGKFLKTPVSKEITQDNPFLSLVKKKKEETENLKKQIEHLSKNFDPKLLIKQRKQIQVKGINGYLLIAYLPIDDRKMLAEITDQLKSQTEPAIIITLGEGQKAEAEKKYPVIASVSHVLQNHITADKILKEIIAPTLNGKGGGQARFAQGVMTEKSSLSNLENILLKHLN